MRANIHPEYVKRTFTCSCGHVFETGTTLGKNLSIEICDQCHPFYTRQNKIIDTAGRVERFNRRYTRNAAQPAAPNSTAAAPVETVKAVKKPKAAAPKALKATGPKKKSETTSA